MLNLESKVRFLSLITLFKLLKTLVAIPILFRISSSHYHHLILLHLNTCIFQPVLNVCFLSLFSTFSFFLFLFSLFWFSQRLISFHTFYFVYSAFAPSFVTVVRFPLLIPSYHRGVAHFVNIFFINFEFHFSEKSMT